MEQIVQSLAGLLVVTLLAGCVAPFAPEGESVVGVEAPAAVSPPALPPHSAPLTVDEAARRAVLWSPRIAALYSAVQVAEQQKRAVWDIQDPELGLAWGRDISEVDRYRMSSDISSQQGEGTQTTTSKNKIESSTSHSRQSQSESGVTAGSSRQTEDGWRMSARFFVPNPWILGPQADSRQAGISAARAEMQNAVWFVTCEVRRLYAELHFLGEDMALATKQVRLGSEILKVVQEQMDKGVKLSSDVTTAAQRYLRIQDEYDQLRYRYKLAQRSLAALLNLPPEQLTVATNAIVIPVAAESALTIESAEMTAKRCRGDLVALGWRALAAKAAYREVRNVRLPWIKEITASYRSTRDDTSGSDQYAGDMHESGSSTRVVNSSDSGAQSQSSSQESAWGSESGVTKMSDHGESEEWWIGFAVDVPVFSWVKNRADEVRLAEYKLARATEDEGIRLSRREIRDALDEVAESRQQQARYQRDVMPIIRSMQQNLVTLKSDPRAMPDKVAATELQILDSLRLELASRKRHLLALINLEYVTGAPL